mgnify:CR=1 FL=1
MRPGAIEMLKHPWLKEEEGAAAAAAPKADDKPKEKATEKQLKDAEGMKQDVPQTLALRRMELMKRLDKQGGEKDAGPKRKFEVKDFTVDGLRAGEQIMSSVIMSMSVCLFVSE